MNTSFAAVAAVARAAPVAHEGKGSGHATKKPSRGAGGKRAALVRAPPVLSRHQSPVCTAAVSDTGLGESVSSVGSSSCGVGASAGQRDEFFELAKNHNLIPLHRRIFADQLTPILAYR